MRLLRCEPRLAPPPGYEPVGIARVVFETIAELPARSAPPAQPGFVWFPMEAEALSERELWLAAAAGNGRGAA